MSPTQQLVQTIVAVLIFVPIFWQLRRKVRDGRLAPVARRTSHHSRAYIVVIASLNAFIVVAFVVGGVAFAADGQWSLGISMLLLAGLMSTFVWVLFRLGSELRREGQTDRAPSITQRSMSRPRRILASVLGGAAGLVLVLAVSSAVDLEWGTAVVSTVVGAVLWGVSWWLYRPARLAEKASR